MKGSSFEPGTKGTTALTFERSDSASVLVWSGPEAPKPTPSTSRASSLPDTNQTGSPAPTSSTQFGATGPGVLWHIFPPEPAVVGAIRRFLISLKPAKVCTGLVYSEMWNLTVACTDRALA